MPPIRVTEWIDIQAPRTEIFELITNLERRMQLSPLWGIVKVTEKCGDYPAIGSSYMVQLIAGQQPEYETVITAYQAPAKFSYCLDVDLQTSVTWTLAETPRGTRLTYSEEFQAPEGQETHYSKEVRKVVQEWMQNIRRYAELRGTRTKRLVRWMLDRFYLNQRPDQRKTIATVVFLHITGAIAFIMAALAMGLASLLF